MLISTKAIAEQALQFIAFHCLCYLFTRYRKTQTRTIASLFTNQDCNTGIAASNIILKYLLELERAR